MLYTALKHTHIVFATLSILLFNLRFWLYFNRERPKWARIAPHIIDTLFLLTGIGLIVMTKFIPFMPGGGWITVKLGLLIGYILFGIFAMRQNRSTPIRAIAYILANSMVLGMFHLALSKPIIF